MRANALAEGPERELLNNKPAIFYNFIVQQPSLQYTLVVLRRLLFFVTHLRVVPQSTSI
jgi:hypothetical protein